MADLEGLRMLAEYRRATAPGEDEIERALLRTLARVDKREARDSLLGRWRGPLVAAAAGALLLGTAGVIGLRQLERDRVEAIYLDEGAEPQRAEAPPVEPGGDGQPHARGATVEVEGPAYKDPERSEANVSPPRDQAPSDARSKRRAPASPGEANPARAEEDGDRREAEPSPSKAEDASRSDARSKDRAGPSSLAEENRLLARGRAALERGDELAALDWADEHARRFPDGALEEERLALEAAAACRGGRRDLGRRRLAELRREFPGAPALNALAELCDAEP